MPVEKRANEWSILQTVYDLTECAHVTESERPDFLLTMKGHGAVPFGVEVTELFRNQADARSVRHPEYLDALFRGAPHMHKDDKTALAVSRARITGSDAKIKGENVPIILTPPVPERDHRRAITRTVRGKTGRCYAVKDGHVNLIIRDRYLPYGEGLPNEYSVTALLSDGVREALVESSFREVYLVSISREHDQVVRPLIQLMLAERFFTFGRALEAALGRPDMDEQWKYVQAFADYAERDGLAIELLDFGGLPVAAHRSSAVGLDEEWGLQLLDFADRQSGLPAWEWHPLERLTDAEVASCKEFALDSEFLWAHYGPPVEAAELQFPKTRSVQVVEVPRDQLPKRREGSASNEGNLADG